MSIKEERPTERRMMMHFDKEFLDKLPVFKECLAGGNESVILRDAAQKMTEELKKEFEPRMLDIGSGDGDWLKKLARIFKDDLELHDAKFTALEPVEDNPKLREVCKKEKFMSVFQRIEECALESGSYDIVTSTHSAYYYYNQPRAHEVLFRLLKPGGWMIVTLVSQFCVLNALTEEALGPHRQFALNAESYISLVSKLGLFSLRKVVPHAGGQLNARAYSQSEEHVRALQHVLTRHRLPADEIESELGSFRIALRKHSGKERVNLIMFFQKAPWLRLGPNNPTTVLAPEIDADVEDLRRSIFDFATKQPPKESGLIELDLEVFVREARGGAPRLDILEELGSRLENAAAEAGGQVNRLRGQIKLVIGKLKSAN